MVDDFKGYSYRISINFPKSTDGKYKFFFEGKEKYAPTEDDLMCYSEVILSYEDVLKKLEGNDIVEIKGIFSTDLKKDDKYYTPESNEFHIGFEYEIVEFSSVNGGPKQLQFTKSVYQGDSYWINIDERRKIKQVRVKFLDKEDIESLGWVNRECTNPDSIYQYFNIGEKSLVYTESTHEVTIHLIEYDWDTGVFHGTVKNKSELKKLMQMLSIK